MAGIALLLGLVSAGCYGGAGSSPDTGSAASPASADAADASGVGPSPTIGYCGMDPEPVPCVDRAGDGGPVPTSVGSVHAITGTCGQQFAADRCQALAFAAAQQLGLGFEQIAVVDVVPNPSPVEIDFAHRTFLSVGLVNGSRHAIVISCPGVSGAYDPPCMQLPIVPLSYPRGHEGGYTDTPENATPFPALDAGAVANARALSVPTLTVPITGTGSQAIVVGTALLPNGFLAEGDFALADPWPSNVLLRGGVSLEIRPTAGGAPLQNVFDHGWHPGVEEVTATLTFDVAWFEPGASLEIVNIVVR
jgi:hypothetical protein